MMTTESGDETKIKQVIIDSYIPESGSLHFPFDSKFVKNEGSADTQVVFELIDLGVAGNKIQCHLNMQLEVDAGVADQCATNALK